MNFPLRTRHQDKPHERTTFFYHNLQRLGIFPCDEFIMCGIVLCTPIEVDHRQRRPSTSFQSAAEGWLMVRHAVLILVTNYREVLT